MAFSKQASLYENGPSKSLVVILVFTMFIGLFIVGFDQGHLFSTVQGSNAFDIMWMHEFTHDIRHSAGFPCH